MMDSTVPQVNDLPQKAAPAHFIPKLCLRLGNPYMLGAQRDVAEANDGTSAEVEANMNADVEGASHSTS